jgi:serine phosphatase RsbU (regulator of sigma subunit)
MVNTGVSPDRKPETLAANLRRLVEAIYGPAEQELPGLAIGRSYWGASSDFPYGGDMVDVFQHSNGCTSLAVIDISGHGIHAAMHAGLTKHALRAYVSEGYNAVDAIRALNRLCIDVCASERKPEFFATAFFAIIDAGRQSLQYVSAGHEAAYIVSSAGHQLLDVTAPILGLLDDHHSFAQKTVKLQPGDTLCAVTDGFTEARNEHGAFLGAAALATVIERNREFTAEEEARAVTAAAYAFAGSRLRDDVASLVVNVLENAAA